MNLKLFVWFYCFTLLSCVTLTKGVLPELSEFKIESQKTIFLSFEDSISNETMENIINSFKKYSLEENKIRMNFSLPKQYVPNDKLKKVEDFFPIKNLNSPPADLKFEITLAHYGFFEPYCVLVLAIIPCTPPIDWQLNVKVTDLNGSFIKEYVIRETRKAVYWMPYFVPSYWDKSFSLGQLVIDQMVQNLLAQIAKDNILQIKNTKLSDESSKSFRHPSKVVVAGEL